MWPNVWNETLNIQMWTQTNKCSNVSNVSTFVPSLVWSRFGPLMQVNIVSASVSWGENKRDYLTLKCSASLKLKLKTRHPQLIQAKLNY